MIAMAIRVVDNQNHGVIVTMVAIGVSMDLPDRQPCQHERHE